MYTIIPLLLAHIQELNKQILFLFNFIVKNIPLKPKEKDNSLFSPKYRRCTHEEHCNKGNEHLQEQDSYHET